MSAVAVSPPPGRIDAPQRLSATLALSLLVHGILILGVGYSLEKAAPVMPTLDVILTQTQTPLTPAQADFLAQANNQGGGEHDKSTRPRDTQSGPVPQVQTGVAQIPLRAQSPEAQPLPQERVVNSNRGERETTRERHTITPSDQPLPPGPQRIDRDVEMARLAAEIHQQSERYAKRPSRKFVSASTKEYVWAAYLRQWVDRVERVGNLNYPDEARRRRLKGQVVISVSLRRNGTIERTDIVRSSGIALLDASALRIARLAEPYPPLPKTQENPDILHVTRTWNFLPGGSMVDE